MGEALGIALASLVNIFNFPLYLLSGGPLPAWEFFSPRRCSPRCRAAQLTYRTAPTRIEPAKLGNEAGLYGAAYLPPARASVASARDLAELQSKLLEIQLKGRGRKNVVCPARLGVARGLL